jgi:hypothetical protein
MRPSGRAQRLRHEPISHDAVMAQTGLRRHEGIFRENFGQRVSELTIQCRNTRASTHDLRSVLFSPNPDVGDRHKTAKDVAKSYTLTLNNTVNSIVMNATGHWCYKSKSRRRNPRGECAAVDVTPHQYGLARTSQHVREGNTRRGRWLRCEAVVMFAARPRTSHHVREGKHPTREHNCQRCRVVLDWPSHCA